MANNKVKHYRTTVAGRKPDATKMQEGEIAINMTDKRLYTKMGTSIVNIGNGADATVEGGQTFTGKVTANSIEAKSSVIKSDTDAKLSFNDQFDKARVEIIAPVQPQASGQLKIRVKDGQDAARGTAEIVINGNGQVSLPVQGNTASSAVRKDQLDAAINKANTDVGTKVSKSGDTMTGNLTVPKVLLSAGQGSEANALTRKDYVDGRVNEKVAKSGDTMTGRLTLNDGLSTANIPNGNTYHWNAWKTSAAESKTYLRGFRSYSGATMWHETVTGGLYRLATGTTDTLDVMTLDQTAMTINGEIRPKNWTNLDARYLNTAGDTATGIMNFAANVNLKKELDFEPSDGKSKDTFTILNWGDNTTTGRTQVWELKDSSGYHFYTQRRGSDKQVSASFVGNVNIVGYATLGVQGTEASSVVRKDYVDGFTGQVTGKVNKSGDTMTGRLVANGGVMFNTDTDLLWSRNTDYAKISFVNTGDNDANSYMKFNVGDNGNEYFKFVSTSGSTERTWVDIKDGQVIPSNYTNFDARYINSAGDTMNGNLTVNGNIIAPNREMQVGNIVLERTANNVARTRIGQWSENTGTNHRFEIYSQGVAAPNQRKNILTADITNANAANASLIMNVAGEFRTDSHITTRGNIIMDSSRPYIHLKGLPAGSGGYVNQGDPTNYGGLFNEIDDADGVSVYSPLIKQRYKQGNLTWSQGILYNAGDWCVHFKNGVGSNTGDRSWFFKKNGDFVSGGGVSASGIITTGTGYGLRTDSIAKRDGTAFIAPDGNINLIAPTNGFAAGWLLGQINNRLNTAQTAATNAQNAANAAMKNTRATTQVWTGNLGGGAQTPSLSQDLRFRNVWFKTGDQWNFIRFAEDGLYHLQSNGGWIHIQLHSNGRIFKNVKDERSVPTVIKVENL
ncbi:TPA: hypothetical protein JLO99_002736 [Escherichia coli]|nr:hypothetical protein [Escherichia coli]